jgi:hypothetical protein
MHHGLILALLSAGQLMVVLDFSIVNVALPTVQGQFHLAAADLQWVISALAPVPIPSPGVATSHAEAGRAMPYSIRR